MVVPSRKFDNPLTLITISITLVLWLIIRKLKLAVVLSALASNLISRSKQNLTSFHSLMIGISRCHSIDVKNWISNKLKKDRVVSATISTNEFCLLLLLKQSVQSSNRGFDTSRKFARLFVSARLFISDHFFFLFIIYPKIILLKSKKLNKN